jgi:cell division septation protein DedD
VQIFASSEQARAREVAAAARSRFGEPVYIEYESPLYKVRVGDCITRTEADALKDRAITQGYDGPWVVESSVQVR